MKAFRAALIGIGLLTVAGCAVYEPYQAYPAYPAYPGGYPVAPGPSVVVQPQIYGYWANTPRYGYGYRSWGGYGYGGHGYGGYGRGRR